MAEANAEQIQQYVNERVRVRAEQVRALLLGLQDDKAAIDDVYAGLTGSQSGWTDARPDGPPRLAAASDVLAYNTFATDLIADIEANANLSTILALCVRPVRVEG